jgi:CBS domain-containing protein
MSVAREIRSAQMRHLDLGGYITAEEATPVREVVDRMRRCDCSTGLITKDHRLTGIFTERDLLKRVLGRPDVLDRPIRDFMTPDPVAVTADVNILGALRRMNEGRFRDLPVVDAEGHILGNLTDNAIVRRLADTLQAEVLNLPPDPEQVPKTVEGA